MNDNKPLEVEISRVRVTCVHESDIIKIKVEYMIRFIHSTNCESGKWISEELFFESKKDLVKSLWN